MGGRIKGGNEDFPKVQLGSIDWFHGGFPQTQSPTRYPRNNSGLEVLRFKRIWDIRRYATFILLLVGRDCSIPIIYVSSRSRDIRQRE